MKRLTRPKLYISICFFKRKITLLLVLFTAMLVGICNAESITTLTSYSKASASLTPVEGWAFYWNAPDGWAPGAEGDLKTGSVYDSNSWKTLKRVPNGDRWTADGDTINNNQPSSSLGIYEGGGRTGPPGSSIDLDRYCISAFRVQQSGDYQLTLGTVGTIAESNGVLVKVFVRKLAGNAYELKKGPSYTVTQARDVHFGSILYGLKKGDEIAVAVGANGNDGENAYRLDYQIAMLKPDYSKPEVIKVSEYGAVGDGTTDDGPALLKAIEAWKNVVGPAVLEFEERRTYKLGETKGRQKKHYFQLNEVSQKVVSGNGAKLVLHPNNRGFDITKSDGIVIRNLLFDYDPLPFTQGRIISKNRDRGSFTVRLDSGFPEPRLNQPGDFGVVFEQDTQKPRKNIADHIRIESMEDLNNDEFEFVMSSGYRKELEHIETNDRFVFNAYTPYVLGGPQSWTRIDECGNVAFENIILFSTPKFAFAVSHNHRPILFRNLQITPPTRSGRLVSSFGDGIHARGNRYGLVIEDCRFTHLMDDSINLKEHASKIDSILSENTIRVSSDFRYKVGDVLQFANYSNATVFGERAIVSISSDRLDLEVSALPEGVASGQYVFNLSKSNPGYVVQNNYFGPKRRTAGFIRGIHGKILNNTSEDNSGIWLHPVEFPTSRGTAFEGPYSRDIEFRGNTILRNKYGLRIDSRRKAGPRKPIRNLWITGNTFKDSPNIDIDEVEGAYIFENTFWTTPIGKLENVGAVYLGENYDQRGRPLDGGASLFEGKFDPEMIRD